MPACRTEWETGKLRARRSGWLEGRDGGPESLSGGSLGLILVMVLHSGGLLCSKARLFRVLDVEYVPRPAARVWMWKCLHLQHVFARRSSVSTSLEEEQEEGAGHVPVLLKDVLEQFAGLQLRSFVDCTLGAGGHSAAIISSHPELHTFIGLDVDPVAHMEARTRLQAVADEMHASSTAASRLNLQLIRTNFRNIKSVLKEVDGQLPLKGVNGVLLDLGMSSMQVNVAERGFSFLRDGPADMRMDPDENLKAEDILNRWPEQEIGRILRDYGEERRWHHIARKIVAARLAGGIKTTSELVEIIGMQKKFKPGLHPATRTFQALRIAVNDELKSLQIALSDAFASLSPGGRLAVISFHSLEDRIVKHFFLEAAGLKSEAEVGEDFSQLTHIPGETRHTKYVSKKRLMEGREGVEKPKNVLKGPKAIILTKRPVIASEEEVETNPRSRSAKLRVIQKV